jgi:hypothetical protein
VPSEPRDLAEIAASNRERIRAVEREIIRLRDRQHELSETVATIAYLAAQVKDLAGDVKKLTSQTATLARRAMSRPSPSLVGQYVGLLIAIAALVVAALR